MYRVAIIGRPNVGKSSLFNRLAGMRRAIVGDEPGMTRDRLHHVVRLDGKALEIIDTGGIFPLQSELIAEKVLAQAETALAEADLVLFVVDVRQGITPLDEALNALLHSRGKDYLLVVNKVDVPRLEQDAFQFYSLGVERLYPVSAEHNQGIAGLLDEILRRVPHSEEEIAGPEIRVAIIGRPNVGKSSLLNRLLGKERAIVTELPGTTRDAVDSLLKFEGHCYRLIDTAGIRRKGRTEGRTEKLSVIMARKHLERADVALLVLDASEGPSKLDATIGGYANKAGKSIILVVNKWDLVPEGIPRREMEAAFRARMRFLEYAPLLFVSAQTGRGVFSILKQTRRAYEARVMRVPTADLNDFFEKQLKPALSSAGGGPRFPVKYAVQVGVEPPTFVFFTRAAARLHFSTLRYLTHQLRDRYGFYATPVRILQRRRRNPRGVIRDA